MNARSTSNRRRKSKPSPAQGGTGQQATAAAGAKSRLSFPIVGIGASAGGLEAITRFFKAVDPHLGMAFVVVPHLDPSRESGYTHILSGATSMPIAEISNNTRVQPNQIYVIPPNCELRIKDHRLQLWDRDAHHATSTIDMFFRTLAESEGKNAIGIVLSGTGSDGTIGLVAIKGEGGITFAQDMDSAKFDGMPSNAISAGCVDFVLTPEGIAQELARVRHHPYVAGNFQKDETPILDQTAESSMAQLFRLLRRATKVDFSEYKPPTIGRRIHRRMALRKVEKLTDYVNLLHKDRNEVHALYQDLLINVTSFFRNPEAFDVLKNLVYPAIVAARNSSAGSIRMWVPGCSTGEEAYSHAISMVEYLDEQKIDMPVQIFATDLSETAIQHARRGLYKEAIEADISPQRLRRFFHKADGGYQMSKVVRELCVFSTQNLFRDPPFCRIDLVSCRNVMIYLSHTLQKRIVPTFHYALNPTGFLMIGKTEGLVSAGSELFEMADKKQKIYRKKPVTTPVNFGFQLPPTEAEAPHREIIGIAQKLPDTARGPIEVQREADRLLLSRYAPPAVVVSDKLEILQSRGHTATFLELPPGKASLNLLKMAREGLLYDLQNAIEEAQQRNAEVVRDNVAIYGNGPERLVTLRVVPFTVPAHEQLSFLIIFENQRASGKGEVVILPPEPLVVEADASERETQITRLRQELAATKEHLQSIIEAQEATNEELQSANEEIQSGNEELQSTNEELQTSKEELESANEELHTVNEEMQHRNELLSQLNNDLINLLNSVDLPLVLLGADLSVRRFTSQASSIMGLMASDIGRPIVRLKLNVHVSDLEEEMLQVMRDVQPRQKRVQDKDGQSYLLNISPYRTMDNHIDGVVLSVESLKNYQASEGAPARERAASMEARTAGDGSTSPPHARPRTGRSDGANRAAKSRPASGSAKKK